MKKHVATPSIHTIIADSDQLFKKASEFRAHKNGSELQQRALKERLEQLSLVVKVIAEKNFLPEDALVLLQMEHKKIAKYIGVDT